MRPACHNRPEATDPNAGWYDTGWRRQQLPKDADLPWKPVYRYRHPWFTDRCATWDGTGIDGPAATNTSYPKAMGWDCSGCRWHPQGAKA